MNKKNTALIALLFIVAMIVSGCSGGSTGKMVSDINPQSSHNLRHLTLEIQGMYCASCGPGIAKMLSETNGIIVAKVSHKENKGEVIYDAHITSKESIINVLPEPYSATVITDMAATEEMVNQVKQLQND